MKNRPSPLSQWLQNPIWYVATVAVLAVVSYHLQQLWWIAGLVALIWGIWLLRLLFWEEEGEGTGAVAGEQTQLQAYLNQTLAYKSQIDRAARAAANKHNRFYLQQMALQLDTCTAAIKELVQRLLLLRQDELVQHDLEMVPAAIADLKRRLAAETNDAIAAQLQHVLAARQNQLAALERLQLTIKQTEIQIEHTLSVLGTIYSQILIGQSTNDMADYGRLSSSIDEEMHRLTDQLEALYEVKGQYWSVNAFRAYQE